MGKENSKSAKRQIKDSRKHVNSVNSFSFVDKLSCFYTNADQFRNKLTEFQVRIRQPPENNRNM